MISTKNLKLMANNLVKNPDDYEESFRRNVGMYLADPNLTIREICEYCDLTEETFKNFLYKGHPLKLKYAVRMAQLFNVSIDELTGAGTLTAQEDKIIKYLRCSPTSINAYTEWAVGYMYRQYNNMQPKKKAVTILKPSCDPDGRLRSSNVLEVLDISHFDDFTRSKIRFGLRVATDFYLPHYLPGDILFIANDRPATFYEHILVFSSQRFAILQRKEEIEDGEKVIKLYSIRDNKPICYESDIDEMLGYICAVEHEKTD